MGSAEEGKDQALDDVARRTGETVAISSTLVHRLDELIGVQRRRLLEADDAIAKAARVSAEVTVDLTVLEQRFEELNATHDWASTSVVADHASP